MLQETKSLLHLFKIVKASMISVISLISLRESLRLGIFKYWILIVLLSLFFFFEQQPTI